MSARPAPGSPEASEVLAPGGAGALWWFDVLPGDDGTAREFRLRDRQPAGAGALPLAPGDLLGERAPELALADGAPLLASMRRVADERGDREALLLGAGPGARATRLRLTALGGGVLVTSQDVTREDRLSRQLALHTTILDTMSEGVCLVRADDAMILYANPKFERTLGYEPGELVGVPAHELVYAASAEEAQAHCAAVCAQVRALGELSYEIEHQRKDGMRILCRATSSRLQHDAYGDIVLVVQQDVTDQRRTLEERDGFFENALDMLCIADFDGRFRRLNPAWAEVLGWSTEELLGRSFLELVHPDDRDHTLVEIANLAQGHATLAFENRFVAIDGSYRVLAWRSVPSRPLGVIFACARDITELRRTEQALRDADAEKDTLLKEIHHRVKNNLQVISSLLKLRADTLTSPEARLALQDSQDRVRSIALLHEKLYRSTDLGTIDLGEYAQGLFGTLLRTYRLEPSPQLVVDSAGLRLELDAAVPVGLILNELMTNALKHGFARSPRAPRVDVVMREADGDITIAFADNGVGYPAAPDGQLTPTLGMDLVRTLASQVGGTLTQTNAEGARCTLRFPRDLDRED